MPGSLWYHPDPQSPWHAKGLAPCQSQEEHQGGLESFCLCLVICYLKTCSGILPKAMPETQF